MRIDDLVLTYLAMSGHLAAGERRHRGSHARWSCVRGSDGGGVQYDIWVERPPSIWIRAVCQSSPDTGLGAVASPGKGK
jgi:hypothetical protein